MKKSLIVLMLATTGLISCEQHSESTTTNVVMEQESLNHAPSIEIQNESRYTDSEGNSVIIQNSYPRGGPYTSPGGKRYGCGVFWSRVINESPNPLELFINFPADSFAILPSTDSYLKLFLPPDTITVDKLSMFNYGIADPKFYLNNNLNQASSKKQTLKPGKESIFCILMLFVTPDGNGRVRTGLVFEGQDLFYRVNIEEPIGSALVPCGRINFKI